MRSVIALGVALCLAAPLVGAQPQMSDPQEGVNPKEVTAVQIAPITVDGDLSDWPAGLEKRVCKEFYPSYQVNAPELSTQENYFMVAWNDEANQIYVAGWSTDDIALLKLGEWWNADLSDVAGASWFYDRWELYFEWDNTDEGAHGDDGTVQYAIAINDPDNTSGVLGLEVDAAGDPVEGGTAFWINTKTDLTADGRPWRSEAKLAIELDDPSAPFGSYTKTFEAAVTPWTYYDGDATTDADLLDLDPGLNEGTGIGFDVTMMDRDGFDATTEDRNTADDQGCWIGWSEGSKNNAPELLGTMLFSLDFAPTRVRDWSLY